MTDPWYSPIITEKGVRVSGGAACMHRMKLEGGPMVVIEKVISTAQQNTLQTILANFNLLPKRWQRNG